MRTDISKFGLSFIVSVLMFSSLVFAQGLQDVINVAKDIGVFQFYLPFIISFAVIYGILAKVNLFGDKARAINAIVALAISAFVMVYTPAGITLSQFFTNLFGNAIVVILTFVVIAIFISVLSSGKILDMDKLIKNYWIGLIFLVLVALGVFVASGGTSIFPGLKISARELFVGGLFGLSSTTLALIILIVGTGLIVWFFFKEGGAAAGGGEKK